MRRYYTFFATAIADLHDDVSYHVLHTFFFLRILLPSMITPSSVGFVGCRLVGNKKYLKLSNGKNSAASHAMCHRSTAAGKPQPPWATMRGSNQHLDVGTRVDCLFGDEYFRGNVDDDGGGRNPRLFRVVFDDGDVREDVPPEDVELPLEPECRVECLFEVGRVRQGWYAYFRWGKTRHFWCSIVVV